VKFLLDFYFFTFCVCEGSLGLSILVSIVCSHGNDYLESLDCIKMLKYLFVVFLTSLGFIGKI